MNIFRKAIWKMMDVAGVSPMVELTYSGYYIKETGWIKSYFSKSAIDKNGNPIPWITYPCIQFLEPRLNNKMSVFEYGCGNSTRWYAAKVHSIVAVDHDKEWVNKIQPLLPSNANVIYSELVYGGEYCKQVIQQNKRFDIVIVDGRDRNNCALNSIKCLSDDGVIIFDNTDRTEYEPSLSHLVSVGFKRLDFYGLGPIVGTANCTSVFYRSQNCLGI